VTGLIGAMVPSPVKLALIAGPYAVIGALALLSWHFDERAVANANALRTQAAQFSTAQATAAQRVQQALVREQVFYQTKASEADRAYQTQLSSVRASTDGYIASHRMQSSAVARDPRTTPAATTNSRASVFAGVPTDPIMVSADDVQICSNAITYGLKAHDWVLTLNP